MSGREDGGPAFPADWGSGGTLGMSLRDWFAGQALAGIMANPAVLEGDSDEAAVAAYMTADALLAVRKNGLP